MFIERSALRWRRWVRRIVLGLLVLLGLGGWGWWNLERTAIEGKKELAAAIAETDQLDPRWRWEEIEADRPAVPDAENSARVIHELADSLNGWEPAEVRLPSGESFWSDEPAPANRQLDEERLALVVKTLKERKRSLDLAISLKDFPRGRQVIELTPDFVSTPLPHLNKYRHLYRLLELEIERLLHERRLKEATDRISAILNAAHGLCDEPSLVSQILRIAGRTGAVRRVERILGMGELGDDELKRLIAVFKAEQGEDPLLIGLRGERAGLHIMFKSVESGQLSPSDLFRIVGLEMNKVDPRVGFADFWYEPRVYEDHSFMLRRMNEACVIAKLPTQEQMAAWREWDHGFRTAKAESLEQKRFVLTFLVTPAIDGFGVSALREQAELSCALAVLAAERFRLAHQRWPKNLQELCPDFLAQVPIDPFDGKPLKLAQKKDGIAIYSVWKDGQDDGGEILNPSINDSEKADLGLRLWDPKHRRLPPEPRKKDEEKDPDNEK